MGKTSKGNRTKGNTRPSSSSHSAQLLDVSGKSLCGFIGFEALEKDIPSYIPVTGQHSSEVDVSVDSNLRMIMRKMIKKDCVTRLKAVQEFTEVCSEKDKDVLISVLPFWPRLFNKLALDNDRRIREATHQANGKLISKVKREVAPYLKNIMATWLLGQCDLYAPAASSAQSLFVNTFPDQKQSEALMHCKTEIFNLFKDNLLEQTPKSLSESYNLTDEEDIESRYVLVISATLQAMKLFMSIITSDHYNAVNGDYLAIVAENKFWKFSKHKNAQIRGSWYTFISFLIKKKSDIFADIEKKLVAHVFGSLAEDNPLVAHSIWEAALHIVSNFDNCWQGISIHKVVLPQLWSLLNEGGKGNAHSVFPCILPFLSKLPSKVLHDEHFQTQFFACLKQGLLCEKIKSSPMECDAIIVTFFECLHYIYFTVPKDGNSSLLARSISDHILPILKNSFYDSKYNYLATSKLYSFIGKFIQTLEDKCSQCDESEKKIVQDALNHFWNNISSLFCKYFDKKSEDKARISIYITYFFHSIFAPTDFSISLNVRFKDEAEESTQRPVNPEIKPLEIYQRMPITFSYIINVVSLLCDKINENADVSSLKILDEILASTLNSKFFNEILGCMSTVADGEEINPLVFFNNVILKWVKLFRDDMNAIMCIVDILFTLCSVVQEPEAVEMLNSCCKVNNPVLLEKILQKVTAVYSSEPVIQKWLENRIVIETLIDGIKAISKTLIDGEFEDIRNDISAYLLCLDCCNMQTYIYPENIEDILHSCYDCIVSYENRKNAECLIAISCDIVDSVLKNDMVCWKENTIHKILSFCFTRCLYPDEFKLTDKSVSRMLSLWKTGVNAFMKNENNMSLNNFILTAAEDLNKSLNECKNSEYSSRVLSRCRFLLQTIKEAKSHSSFTFDLSELLKIILPTEDQWSLLRQSLQFSLIQCFVEKKVFYINEEKDVCIDRKNIYCLNMRIEIISRILSEEIKTNSDISSEDYFEVIVMEQLPHLMWALSYVKGNGYMHEDFDFKQLDFYNSEENLAKILNYLPFEKVELLLENLYNFCVHKDSDWIFALRLYSEIAEKLHQNFRSSFSSMLSYLTGMENENASKVLQMFSHYLPVQRKVLLLRDLLEDSSVQTSLSSSENLEKLAKICSLVQNSEVLEHKETVLLLSEFLKALMEKLLEGKDKCSLKLTYMLSVIAKSLEEEQTIAFLYSNAKAFFQDICITVTDSRSMLVLFKICSIYMSLQAISSFKNESELQEINTTFLKFLIRIKRALKRFNPLYGVFDYIMNTLLEAVTFIPLDVINIYAANFTGLESCLENFTSSLVSNIPQLQLICHMLLMKLMPYISQAIFDQKKNSTNDNEEVTIPSILVPLIDTLKSVNELVDHMLLGIKIGDCCSVVPNTDSYMLATAFLFVSLELLQFFSSSPSQVRSGYVSLLEEEKILSKLYSNVYPLMPESPFQLFRRNSNSENENKENLISLFFHCPDISTDNSSPEDIQKIACYVFCTAMRVIPASVRTWWNNLDKKSADVINRFTTKYIGNIICEEEIQSVYENENLFKNMVVKARLGSKEVVAKYTVDDFSLELHLQLPNNYPLGPVTAEKRGKIVLAQHEWRQWLMKLTTVLNYQNGSVLDSLNIWKKNLEKKFEGVEECMICYYILHNSTMKLPNLSCHVCRKKFHNTCLYKWFNTSNNFTCPLCRNEFSGLY